MVCSALLSCPSCPAPVTPQTRLYHTPTRSLFLQRVHVQLVNYKKDGSPFLNNLRITPLRSSLGELTHMLGILQEVTLSPGLTCQVSATPSPNTPQGHAC